MPARTLLVLNTPCQLQTARSARQDRPLLALSDDRPLLIVPGHCQTGLGFCNKGTSMEAGLETIARLDNVNGKCPDPCQDYLSGLPRNGEAHRVSRPSNLVLVARPAWSNLHQDLTRIAQYVRQLAPDVRPIVLWDTRYSLPRLRLFLRPTVVVSPLPIRHLAWCPGIRYQANLLTKSEEYTALEKSGIPVPRWVSLTRDHVPQLDEFGPYVVCKPDAGGKGAEVKIKRKGRVRWKPPANSMARRFGAKGQIVQEFIYTGQWPISYRVTTLFGKALYSWKIEADRSRRPLLGPTDWRGGDQGGGMSICSSGKSCTFQLNHDRDIIELGERAHRAFPQIPVLGVDILREQPSGRLYVIEVNATGGTWHFSGKMGARIQRDSQINFESQFDGLRTAAQVLVDQTRRSVEQ